MKEVKIYFNSWLYTAGFMERENIKEAGVCADEKVTYLTTEKNRRQRGIQEEARS